MKISTRLRTSLYWATIVAHIPWINHYLFGRRRKYFTTRVNRIILDFVQSYRTHYFDLQSFKAFQIIVVRAKKGSVSPF